MSWASKAIEDLQEGLTVTIKPHGRSMEPRVESGQEVFLEPVELEDLKKNDVVLCKVKGNVYLHLVKQVASGKVLIGNNKGRTNGWTSKVYGRTLL